MIHVLRCPIAQSCSRVPKCPLAGAPALGVGASPSGTGTHDGATGGVTGGSRTHVPIVVNCNKDVLSELPSRLLMAVQHWHTLSQQVRMFLQHVRILRRR